MAQIRHIISGNLLTVEQEPVFKGGIWECGDQRFSDPSCNQYELVQSDEPAKISVIEFKLLFPMDIRVAINEARETDATIADFYGLLDDPRTTAVDLSIPAVQDMINYLAVKNLITSDLKNAIIAYKPQG